MDLVLLLLSTLDHGLWEAETGSGIIRYVFTVVPTKSDSDEMFCLQLLSKALTCILHLI